MDVASASSHKLWICPWSPHWFVSFSFAGFHCCSFHLCQTFSFVLIFNTLPHLCSTVFSHEFYKYCYCEDCVVCCVSSFPSVFSLCLLCVAGGEAGFLAAADEAHLLAIHLIIPSIKAWSSLHFHARLFRLLRTGVYRTTRLLILVATRISKPASTLPFQPTSTAPTNKLC